MQNLHNEINDLTQYEVDTRRIQRLERKQKPKTKAQRLKGFFIVLVAVGFICQFLSAVLASSGVYHYLSMKLNSNGFILSITSICILLFIEGSKRFTLESYHAQRIDDNKIHRITYAFIMLWGCLSIGSTYWGTPYSIEHFAASPQLVSIDSIKNDFNQQLAKDKSILLAEIEKHTNTAADIKNRSSWKGRISRSARPAYLAAVTAKKDSEVRLSELSILNNQRKTLAVESAIKENKQILKQHSAWCYSFGSTLALISVFLELLFFGAFWWCENYKRLEVLEAKSILKLKDSKETKDTEQRKPLKDKGKPSLRSKDIVKQAVSEIGFNRKDKGFTPSVGFVQTFEGAKKARIFIPMADGTIKDYNMGGLNNLYKQSSADRKEVIKPFLEELKKYEE